jgi:hypothetical protein
VATNLSESTMAGEVNRLRPRRGPAQREGLGSLAMTCLNRTPRSNLDLPAYLDEMPRRNVEQVDGAHRVTQHEGENRQSPP